MNALIVGGGPLGYFFGRTFIAKGHGVTIINRDRTECTSLARRLEVTVVHGDGTDPLVLAGAGADAADAVLAVTDRDQDNLVVCQLAGLRFGVKRTVALVNDPDNEQVFHDLGVRAVSTTRILAGVIEQSAGFDEIASLVPMGGGKVHLSEAALDADSPALGHPLSELALPEDTLIACVLRDDEPIVPRGGTRLQDGDRVIVLTLPQSYGRAIRLLTGEDES